MKRDWDLVRVILLKAESLEHNDNFDDKGITDCDWRLVAQHLLMLDDAGFIQCIDPGFLQYETRICTGLTWKGLDFLDQIREKSVWEKTKKIITEKGMDITIHTIKIAAAKAITQLLS